MNEQPTALRLADELCDVHTTHVARNAADELRRLHAENEALRADAADFHMAYRMKCDEQTKALHAENEALRADAADFHMAYRMKCDEQTKALHAEVEALRADAERYRWLRGNARATSEHWGGRWSLVIEGPAPGGNAPAASIDAAIDAARERT
jgi:hypothetical protein